MKQAELLLEKQQVAELVGMLKDTIEIADGLTCYG